MMMKVCNLEMRAPSTLCGVAILLSKKVINLELSLKEVAIGTRKAEKTLKATLKLVEKNEELIIG